MAIKKIKSNLLYIVICVCYIAFLCLEKTGEGYGNTYLILRNILVSVWALFFMLAGNMLFDDYNGDLKQYYLKKSVCKYILPFVLASLGMLISKIGFSVSFGFAKDFIKNFISGTICEDYWICYEVIGMYLIAPFFKRLTDGLNDKEKRWFLFTIVFYFALFSCAVWFSFKFALDGYPFANWVAYAVSGYLVVNIDWKKAEKVWIYVVGILSVLVSAAEVVFWPGRNWSLDSFSLTRILMCLAIMLWGYRKSKTIYIVYLVILLAPFLGCC
nr:hypothetical protein [Lachnospiraceae bacterium]